MMELYNNLIFRKTDGYYYCRGTNKFFQFPNITENDLKYEEVILKVRKLDFAPILYEEDIKDIINAWGATFIITRDNKLYACGGHMDNNYGYFGDNYYSRTEKTPTLQLIDNDVVEGYNMYHGLLYRKSDGSLYVSNNRFNCANVESESMDKAKVNVNISNIGKIFKGEYGWVNVLPNNTEIEVYGNLLGESRETYHKYTFDKPIKSVSMGFLSIIVVFEDGTTKIMASEKNKYEYLGALYTPDEVETFVDGADNVDDVINSMYNVIYKAKDSGNLYITGRNTYGLLGEDYRTTATSRSLVPMKYLDPFTVKQISLYSTIIVFLTDDHKLYGLGRDYYRIIPNSNIYNNITKPILIEEDVEDFLNVNEHNIKYTLKDQLGHHKYFNKKTNTIEIVDNLNDREIRNKLPHNICELREVASKEKGDYSINKLVYD